MKHSQFIEQVKEEFSGVYQDKSYLDESEREVIYWSFIKQKLTQAIENYREEVRVERRNSNYSDDPMYDKARRQEYGHNNALQEVEQKDKEYWKS